MTRTDYISRWKATLAAIERKYIKATTLAVRDQIIGVVRALETGGVDYARSRLSSLQFSAPMGEVIQKMHREVGVMMATRTQMDLRKLPKQAKATVEDFLQLIVDYFRLYNLESVQQISDTTRKHILDILEQGHEAGWSVDEMAKRINNQEYMAHRAATIVRTESVRAANYGVQIGAEAYEYETVKEWVAIRDDRTRHSHRFLNGVQRELDEPFKDNLAFPGDPAAEAAEVVNCRCTMAIVAKRDVNGHLIPKVITLNPGSIVRAA